jgi:predicted permease
MRNADQPPPRRRFFRLELGPHRVERDVDAELAFHLDMRVRRLVERGMDPATARAEALRQFGDWNLVRSELLDIDYQQEKTVKRANYISELGQDVLYAIRSLRNNAGFALVIVLSLAIGIGANTAIFTLIDALLLRPLPVPNASELVVIGDSRRVNSLSDGSARTDLLSYPAYDVLRKHPPLLTGLAASGRTGRLDLIIDDGNAIPAGRTPEPEQARGRLVSGNYFDVLRVPAFIGRPITVEDDRVANGSPVVVLSHAYWTRRFASDRNVIGRSIIVNRTPFTIIGVAPPGFHGEIVGRMSDVWMPLTMQPALMHGRQFLARPITAWLLMIGRRAPGVTLEQVQAAYPALVRQAVVASTPNLELRNVERDEVPVSSGERGMSALRSAYGESLGTLMVAVGLVLLVVCANVANLLLARGAARAREMGVRMALGAGRSRLVRQLLTESLMLGALGGVLGLVLAAWGTRALLRLAAGGATAVPLDATIDWRVLGFTALVTGITAILFGSVPAVRATRVELAATLRSNSRGLTGGLLGAPGRVGVGKLLVVAQVALSLTLLVGTGMLVRSTRALTTLDTGLARDRLLIVTLDVAPTGLDSARLTTFTRTTLERVRRIPGVVAASFSENGIFSGTESSTTLQAEGFVARTENDTTANYDRVGPDYFTAIGAKLVQGRDFRASDDERSPRVAVINSTMAAFFFPGGNVLGRRVTIDSASYEVVGVVADTKDHELRGAPTRRIYLPIYQSGALPTQLTFELRTNGDPAKLVTPARLELRSTHPSLLILSNDPLTALMRLSISQDLLVSWMASLFGALALSLAALGLYGVMTYATTRRTSEFGLRMALGAESRTVGRMVLGEAMRLVVGGTILGLPLAIAATRLLRNQLYGVNVIDLPSIVIALVVLAVSAALAGYLPATRAARVGPLEALRTE